jgi:ribosomal protein S25
MRAKNIMDIIGAEFEDFDMELNEKIKDAPGYDESQKSFNETIHTLEKATMFKIDSDVMRMEAISKDVAVNEGFKLAVKLIFSALTD